MSQREEFVKRSLEEGANMSALCREYEISRKTGYKWQARYLTEGYEGLRDRSRRPQSSPRKTQEEVEQVVLELREQHPAWGGRKLKRRLEDLGHQNIPAASTITEILRRHGKLEPEESAKRQAYQRFEMARPNELWQMDFKGHFELKNGERCHPLSVLDDHSRYLIGLKARLDERLDTVHDFCTWEKEGTNVPTLFPSRISPGLLSREVCLGVRLLSRLPKVSSLTIKTRSLVALCYPNKHPTVLFGLAHLFSNFHWRWKSELRVDVALPNFTAT